MILEHFQLGTIYAVQTHIVDVHPDGVAFLTQSVAHAYQRVLVLPLITDHNVPRIGAAYSRKDFG